jgi:tRNA(Arg) A34 adenosine deaminase TadA
MEKTSNPYLLMALEEAKSAAQSGEVPVGAVLVEAASGKVLAKASNRTETDSDATAHAEMLVLRAASKIKNSPRLEGCDLYVSLEPCAMCAAAISFARIRRLYYGAYDPKGGAVDHGPKFFAQSTCHHRPEVYGGIMEKEAAELLQGFFKQRRD